ncbi:MAG: hypothetical protein JXQ83_11285, partial [Candidatus Glassbacteria bacterium]|nr:hypothetical protein [Candidatus Glassbacteria bacterium]
MKRRSFVTGTMAGATAAAVSTSVATTFTGCGPSAPDRRPAGQARVGTRKYCDTYTGEFLNRVAFPLGGIG